MVFFQLDLARFITVYIGQGLIFAFFVIIAFKLIRRGNQRLNIILSFYYIFVATGLFFNFIYAPITDLYLVKILNIITNYFVSLGLVFLMLYNLILARSGKGFSTSIQLIIVIFYGILLSVIFFVPNEVKIDASTNWTPVWSFSFFAYMVIIGTAICVIPTIISSIIIYKRFGTEMIKKRWRRFVVGVYGTFFIMYGLVISNTLNDPIFRSIYSLISISIVIWGILMYYGVGRPMNK